MKKVRVAGHASSANAVAPFKNRLQSFDPKAPQIKVHQCKMMFFSHAMSLPKAGND